MRPQSVAACGLLLLAGSCATITPTPPLASVPPPAASEATSPKVPAKAPAPAARAAPAPKKESAAPTAAATPKAPPLDLATLEQRLKETNAIGVMTKLSLKNQVDELLGKFRAYYQGKLKVTLAELRQPYEMLLFKVLSLLQDSDPSLASAITASREAIWGILSDPKKFSSL